MKKTTWLLLALSLVAMLLVAGCQPTTPTPTASPTPTPTATPTTPPADYCPTAWETVVTSLYCGTDSAYAEGASAKASFSILISFDEAIALLDDNENNWEVKVSRWVPYKADSSATTTTMYTFEDEVAQVIDVYQAGANSIRITATVNDKTKTFYGLICGETCYKDFVKYAIGGTAVPVTDFYVDSVSWAYVGTAYPYADILGNPCPESCEIEDEVCCTACEVCPTPTPGPPCPPGGCI